MGDKRIPTVKWRTRWGWHEGRTRLERQGGGTMNKQPLAPVPQKLFRKKYPVRAYRYEGDTPFIIHTLEGDMIANPGDWIITGVKGETYACKPDIFESTYEPVAD